jgi:hypothetical protein
MRIACFVLRVAYFVLRGPFNADANCEIAKSVAKPGRRD